MSQTTETASEITPEPREPAAGPTQELTANELDGASGGVNWGQVARDANCALSMAHNVTDPLGNAAGTIVGLGIGSIIKQMTE